MTIEELVERYVRNTQKIFHQINERGHPIDRKAEQVLDHAMNYLDDAIYYCDRKRFEIALVSVAYCEGLLDALRLLELVKFEWSMQTGSKRECR